MNMKFKLRHNTAMRLIMGSFLLIVIPAVLFLVVWPLAGCRWALLLPCLWELLMAYGFFFGWRHIIVRRATCVSPLLPASFDGYRVLQLSDIHIGTYLRNRRFIDKLVALVNAQHADLVVFTGAEEVIPFQHVLRQVRAADGVLSIMGNHDYCEYGADKSRRNVTKNQTVLHYLEEKIGWHLLMNEHKLISRGGDNIAVIGVENISRPPFQDYGDLSADALGPHPCRPAQGGKAVALKDCLPRMGRQIHRERGDALCLYGHRRHRALPSWRMAGGQHHHPAAWRRGGSSGKLRGIDGA